MQNSILADCIVGPRELPRISKHDDKGTYHVLNKVSAWLSSALSCARASEIDATWQAKLMLSRQACPTEGYVRPTLSPTKFELPGPDP